MSLEDGGLRHPLLAECASDHAFGTRALGEPIDLARPRQVHGCAVWVLESPPEVDRDAGESGAEPRADVVVSAQAGVPVGVVTADCVPVLLANRSGTIVAAVHAGWRGLARGVISEALAALRRLVPQQEEIVAVLGPHIGPCCYEVDAPVLDELSERFANPLASAARPGRPGHHQLDLGALTQHALHEAGLPEGCCGGFPDTCTHCDSTRFHSYRRDGPRAGRLVHFIVPRAKG